MPSSPRHLLRNASSRLIPLPKFPSKRQLGSGTPDLPSPPPPRGDTRYKTLHPSSFFTQIPNETPTRERTPLLPPGDTCPPSSSPSSGYRYPPGPCQRCPGGTRRPEASPGTFSPAPRPQKGVFSRKGASRPRPSAAATAALPAPFPGSPQRPRALTSARADPGSGSR